MEPGRSPEPLAPEKAKALKQALRRNSRRLTPKQAAFAEEYIQSGNATQSYKAIKPTVSTLGAVTGGYRLANNEEVRAAICKAMQDAGVTYDAVSGAVSGLLTDPTVIGRHYAIQHSRAILGLDAPTEHHSTIDRRSVNINLDISKDSLSSMIEATREE